MNRDNMLIEADELLTKIDNENIRIYDATILFSSWLPMKSIYKALHWNARLERETCQNRLIYHDLLSAFERTSLSSCGFQSTAKRGETCYTGIYFGKC